MKTKIMLLALCAVCLVFCGCNTQQFERTTYVNGNPIRVVYSSFSLFNNSSVKGLSVDNTTGTTSTGFKITGQANEVASDAIEATFEGAGKAFGAGLRKSITP